MPEPRSTPPSLTPDQAIQLLGRYLKRGWALLEKNPLPDAERQAWQTAATDALKQAFGSPHLNIATFSVAGQLPQALRRRGFGEPPPPPRDTAPLYRDAMKRQLILLQGSLEQLAELSRVTRGPAPTPVRPDPERYYDDAQICLNGHVVNQHRKTLPVHDAAFCRVCGAATTTTCERAQCQQPIRGQYFGPDTRGIYEKPGYCHECGWPYPWTTAALKAARELVAELDDLSLEERQALDGSLDDLVKDSPRTMLAATRFKKLVAKAGTEAAGALRQILITVVTQAAKGQIWPG